ncbi:CAP domain-containing protein [Oceanirhabdus seepicola]|uniref:LysM peptidoglycan-binding domain-containing protein n=1 Tax=Oceanirhabdus seepicola TaxID=2828781 RepID=A0A9J6P979_9CLOT|nr:CAP domain-containing protein [Oceanirhabdus seepicola]MCM1991936.1 LysM peptidoglycan-binding domain-containing protein [Oceanirhabdus seepicola]
MKRKLISFSLILMLFMGSTASAFGLQKDYIVKRGDTLWRICKKNNINYRRLLSANPKIRNPRVLFRGQRIIIPDEFMEPKDGKYAPEQPPMPEMPQVPEKPQPEAPKPKTPEVPKAPETPKVSMSDFAKEVVELVNKERVSNGLQPLKAHAKLTDCAQAKAQNMIDKNYFAHNSPTYGTPFDMIEQWGIKFTAAGENIAYGQKTPKEVMQTWMDSPGHRSNILSDSFAEIGVGVATNKNGVIYWTQMFMRAAKGN